MHVFASFLLEGFKKEIDKEEKKERREGGEGREWKEEKEKNKLAPFSNPAKLKLNLIYTLKDTICR